MLDYIRWLDDDIGPDEPLYLSARNQEWDDATLKQLRDDYHIFFMSGGNGVIPVMVLQRTSSADPLIILGSEDDGTIRFDRYYGQFQTCFSSYWVPYLVSDLMAAKAFADEVRP